VVAGAVSVPVLLPGGPVALLQLGLLLGRRRQGWVVQLVVDGLPLLPGLELAWAMSSGSSAHSKLHDPVEEYLRTSHDET
jgi:hypothetical protein